MPHQRERKSCVAGTYYNRCHSILDISCVADALCIVGDILLLVGDVSLGTGVSVYSVDIPKCRHDHDGVV